MRKLFTKHCILAHSATWMLCLMWYDVRGGFQNTAVLSDVHIDSRMISFQVCQQSRTLEPYVKVHLRTKCLSCKL